MNQNHNYLKERSEPTPVPGVFKVYTPDEVQKVSLEEPKNPLKVEISNPEALKAGDIQKVEIENIADLKVVVENTQEFPKEMVLKGVDLPAEMKKMLAGFRESIVALIPNKKEVTPVKVERGNFPIDDLAQAIADKILKSLPIGFKDVAGKADPEGYMNVRLTTGTQFYSASRSSAIAGGGSGGANGTIGTHPQTGQVRIATNNIPITLSSTPAKIINGVIVRALDSNSADVYIGAVGVSSTTGHPLVAKESTSLAVNDLSSVYIVGAAGDGVSFITSN